MSTEIIIRYAGPFGRKPRFSLDAGGDNSQIAIREYPGGKETIIFTGKNFSPEEYEQNGGKAEEKTHFARFKA